MMIQLAFDKSEITSELGINPNEKNKRILERMKQVFNWAVFDNCISITYTIIENCPINCYSEGRGKTLKFYVELDENLMPYFNLKFWLMQNCGFRSDFDFDLVLKHLYLVMNNSELITLNEIAERLDTDLSTIERHRDKLNHKVFATKDYCKRCIFDNQNRPVSYDQYESIQRSFKNAWDKAVNDYPNQTTVEIYVKHDSYNYTGGWEIVSTNERFYSEITDNLVSKGYIRCESGQLYTNGTVNKYVKDKSYLYHLEINGVDYFYIKTIYQLTERMRRDKEFKDLVINAYNCLLLTV